MASKLNILFFSLGEYHKWGLPLSHTVQFRCSVMSDSLRTPGLQHTWPPCPLQPPRVYQNSSPLSRWCHPTISCCVIPFSSRLQSFPASGSFQMSQFFASGGQSIGVSASASVLPVNIQDWFHLGWTGWISLKSKGLSRVFSNTTVRSINSSFTYAQILGYLKILQMLWNFVFPCYEKFSILPLELYKVLNYIFLTEVFILFSVGYFFIQLVRVQKCLLHN